MLLAIALAALAYAYETHSYNFNFINNGAAMDGTVWDVRIKPHAWLSFSHKDTLVFDSGRMAAVGYMASGYPSGAYNSAGHKDQCSWQVAIQRSSSDTIQWTGHVADGSIEGDIVQHDENGRVRKFHFTGVRRLS
jgi:hypothetical protein